MSDIKLYRLNGPKVRELEGQSVALEKSLQTLIERHLEVFLGVRFLATEYATGKAHGGRIDTLGIDENGCPVIIEYKRATNQNVINQGLFYLNWLLDHRAEFKLLVIEHLGPEAAKGIEWSSPRLLCIAGNFTKFDEHAVQQMNRDIELLRYRRYGNELLLLELVNATDTTASGNTSTVPDGSGIGKAQSVLDKLEKASAGLRDLFHALRDYLTNLGDDVIEKRLKWYYAYRRIRNFACVQVHPQKNQLQVFVHVDPNTVKLERGFTQDMRKIGHLGNGDLRITLKTAADLERAKPLLTMSYESR